jgi:flagellar biosynthesis component FlhA
LDIKSDEADYKERLQTLEAERKFVEAYGEEALKFESTINPIRVEVRESVFSDILDDNLELLSSDTLSKAEAMRARMHEKYGITLPGVNFGVHPFFPLGREYVIRIMDRDEYPGHLTPRGRFAPSENGLSDVPSAPAGTWLNDGVELPGSKQTWPVNDYILHHVQNVAEHHLAEFLGHQETFGYLQNSGLDAAKAILEKPKELTRSVKVLQGLLRRRISIAPVELIVNEFTRLRKSGSEVDAIIDSLTATLEPDAVHAEGQASVQQ